MGRTALLWYTILYFTAIFPSPCGKEENTAHIPTPERRNKMKKQILAALTLLLLLLSACHREDLQKQTEPSPKETQQSEDIPQPEDNGITVTEDVSSGEEKAQDGTLLLRYSLSSPQVLYQGEPMMNIGSYYDNNTEKSLLSITEELLPMARQRQQDGDFLGNFQWDEEFAIMRNKGNYLSIRRDRSQYTGGVHGSLQIMGDNWLFRAGDYYLLSLTDILPGAEDPRALVMEQALEQAKQQEEAQPGLFYENYQETMGDVWQEDWYLTEESLVVVFQEYALGPYTSGPMLFEIPFTELGDNLTEELRP